MSFRLLIWVAYRSYKEAGLNALFLVLPAKLLVPTLVKYGASIGENPDMQTPITFHNVCTDPSRHYANLKIGSDCYSGKEVFLDLADTILIEDQVTFSMRVTILTHTHAGKSPLTSTYLPPSHAPVTLRRGCYIGAGAIILPGVEIGEAAIVGAGAVVTHNVPAATAVVGVPARVISRNMRATDSRNVIHA